MKRWLPVALCAVTLVGAVPALTRAQASPPAPTTQQSVPDPIIRAKNHPQHATVFSARLNKNAALRAAVDRKGYDVAFTEWMKQDHPYEYATYCTKQAKEVTVAFKNTEHMAEFNTLVTKRADLRAAVKSVGYDVAFADWLRRERPDAYRKHFGIKKPINPFMNDKQMPRGMPM